MGGSAKETWIDTGWTDILTDDGHRVVTPDLLGHGSAERPHDPDAYAHLRQGAQDAVGDEKPLVGVGFSLGARVLVEWALAEPDRFSKLALLGMGDNLFAAWDPTPMISALEGTASIDHPFVERLLELTSRNGGDPLAVAAMLRYRGNDAIEPSELSKITCPTLVVFGELDGVGDPQPLVDALPNATFTSVRRCDHFATTSKFETIEAVARFV